MALPVQKPEARRSARQRWRPAPQRRMAGHQRAGRLCFGHRRRRVDPPLSRSSDRRAAESAGPHHDAECAFGTHPPAQSGRLFHGPERVDRRGPARHSRAARIPARRRTARSGATNCGGFRSGEAHVSWCTGRTPCMLPTGCFPGPSRSAWRCGPAPLPLARCARSARRSRRNT